MKHRLAIAIMSSSALLLSWLWAQPATAAEDRIEASPETTYPWGPLVSQNAPLPLSGPAWLIATGIDTRLWPSKGETFEQIEPGNTRLQAVGPGAAALVPFRDPSPKFSRNVLISRDFSRQPIQTEPHIAVDPKDPDHIVVAMIDFNFPNVTSYVSFDGGAKWEGPYQSKFIRGQLAGAGDPVLSFGRDGNIRFAYISLDQEEFSIGPAFGFATVSSIAVATSVDGGVTWGDAGASSRSTVVTRPFPTPPGQLPRGEVEFQFLDKPWMTIGPQHDNPDKDAIYVTYTKFITTYQLGWIGEAPIFINPVIDTMIELVRSEDGGATWSKPIQLSPRTRRIFGQVPEVGSESPGVGDTEEDTQTVPQAQQAQGTRRFVQGSQVAVAPDGTVYVAWMDTTNDDAFKGIAEIYIDRSDDGGTTFGRPLRAVTFLEPGFQPRNAPFRYWASSFPQLTVGPRGEVYVIYTAIPPDKPVDDGDIYIVRSLDRGESWSRRQRVNDDDTTRLQFFPAISVGPDGTLHVMWGDMRNDTTETNYHIYYASSDNQGDTWAENARVTDFPSNPNFAFPQGRFIGDYFAIKAVAGDVYMVWADSRLGELGPVNQKIGFARKRLMPTPSIFISPPSGPGGRDVVVQGFNFQPDREAFIEVGGVLISTGRTRGDGQFSSRIFIPISGEGAHPVRLFDASGNVAESSFYMEFGFDNVQKMTQEIVGLSKQTQTEELTAEVRELRKLVESQRLGAFPWTTLGLILGGIVLLASAIFAGLIAARRISAAPTSKE